jgi:hypothetical protein
MDSDLAARHFLDLCAATTMRRLLFAVGDPPTQAVPAQGEGSGGGVFHGGARSRRSLLRPVPRQKDPHPNAAPVIPVATSPDAAPPLAGLRAGSPGLRRAPSPAPPRCWPRSRRR